MFVIDDFKKNGDASSPVKSPAGFIQLHHRVFGEHGNPIPYDDDLRTKHLPCYAFHAMHA